LAVLSNPDVHQDVCVFGIDFGSRYSGNTVIAIYKSKSIFFMDVDENVDADTFVLNAAKHFKPALVFIDAPLSLPGKYTLNGQYHDYNFREADKALCAMSPMFLGGLTARAIKLKDELVKIDIEVAETYPRVLAQRFNLKDLGYKSSKMYLSACREAIKSRFQENISINCKDIISWHHLDALLALMSALNYRCGRHETYGHAAEGIIII
jgi:predicted nuclease with RNAse H fold